MLLQAFIVSAVALTAVHGALIVPQGIPDGAYIQHLWHNGTRVTESLDDPGRAHIVSHTSTEVIKKPLVSAKLQKRSGECFKWDLDHEGVDSAGNMLRDVCGTGGYTLVTDDKNVYTFTTSRGVMMYYCIDAPHSRGNCDVTDVNYAMKEMDRICNSYQASYYRWTGTPEIIGKDKVDANVCV